MEKEKDGRLLVLTGDGKGKSTSAFGMAMRAVGWNQKVCIIQFLKKSTRKTGEQFAAQRLGIEWHTLGDGFTWNSPNLERDKTTSQNIWKLCREKILSDQYNLLILDEINTVLSWEWLPVSEIIACLKQEKPPRLHIIFTGRNAPAELIAVSDTVTEMISVKHAFQQGVRATKGIEL
ncbi:MAG: cob(I)yrinic acid a,c-diamide adenosyltransferase [Magnetococcus sp. YQC-5]